MRIVAVGVLAAGLAACGSDPAAPGPTIFQLSSLTLAVWEPPWYVTDEAYPPWTADADSYLRLELHPDGTLGGEARVWVQCYWTDPATSRVELYAQYPFLAAQTGVWSFAPLPITGTWTTRDGLVWLALDDTGFRGDWITAFGWQRRGGSLVLDIAVEGLVMEAVLDHR